MHLAVNPGRWWQGNYTFDQTPEDITLLGQLAKIAQQARSTLSLAQASSHVLGLPFTGPDPEPGRLERN